MRQEVQHFPDDYLKAKNASAGGDKVAGIVIGMETYEVSFEDCPEHLFSHRQGAVNLRRGEGRVQKPSHLQQAACIEPV